VAQILNHVITTGNRRTLWRICSHNMEK